jgi:hypothetical protein
MKIIVDPPLPEPLARARVVIQYRALNLHIVPVFGAAALAVSPRAGHVHVTLDDGPWDWAAATGDPVILDGLAPGPHKVLIELANSNHQILDSGTVHFSVPDASTAGAAKAGKGGAVAALRRRASRRRNSSWLHQVPNHYRAAWCLSLIARRICMSRRCSALPRCRYLHGSATST